MSDLQSSSLPPVAKAAVEPELLSKLEQMIDGMPVAVMTADPNDDFKINYLNRTSIDIMRRIQSHLPFAADDLLGKSIDVFHADASHQRAILADPSRLPFKTRIRIAGEVLSLEVTAIVSKDGGYLGPMVTWGLVTEQVRLSDHVSGMANALAKSYNDLEGQAAQLHERAAYKAEVATRLADVAERMEDASRVISSHVVDASTLTHHISAQASATQEVVSLLEERASTISTMSAAIGQIAGQTNLLALNATIEAARAGDAGRGFAVVAQEVKALAAQTARTNDEISRQIAEMLAATAEAAAAIRFITTEIVQLYDATERVKAANDQQMLATQAVINSVSNMRIAVTDSSNSAETVSRLATELSENASRLQSGLDALLG